MKLSEKLKLLREEKGMTQDQVCIELGIGIQSLRNYENTSIERIPNTIQLKMLKEFYNVTYEYLLDDNCQNRTNESIDIGKTLNLSDTSISKIKSLQFYDYSFLPENHREISKDKNSSVAFNNWIENFSDLHHFAMLLDSFYTLNKIIEITQYFGTIMDLTSYIIHCLNTDKIKLNSLFELLDNKLEDLKFFVTDGDKSSLDYSNYKEIDKEYKKLKKYCTSYDKKSKKNNVSQNSLETDSELFYILNDIWEIGLECYQITYKDLKFCQFEIVELIKDNLNHANESVSLPIEYENMKKLIRKEMKF